MGASELTIKSLSVSSDQGTHRVRAVAGGFPVHFESEDLSLRPSPEAFAGAFLVPALVLRSHLCVDLPLDPVWLSHVQALMEILNEWWDYPSVEIRGPVAPAGPGVPRGKTALCFSGGVDSFHSLLRGEFKTDFLVFAHGYDMALSDKPRMAAWERSLRAVAAATGTRAVVVRTDLRKHPVFRAAPWVRSHGGALAALGHLLPGVGRLVVSASYPFFFRRAWGSHWRTDPLWSSGFLQVAHTGADLWRAEKLRNIAREPLVQEHLRVCWENRTPAGNCSRCEKCLRTMLILADCGQLDHFKVFDRSDSIARRLDALPSIDADLIPVYRGMLERGLTFNLSRAVRSLISRSLHPDRISLWRVMDFINGLLGIRPRRHSRRTAFTAVWI